MRATVTAQGEHPASPPMAGTILRPPSPEQIECVRESFATLEPALDPLGELYFRHLHALEPTLKNVLPGAPADQRKALSTLLRLAVATIGRLNEVIPALRLLAAKARGLRIGPYYYGAFGEALIRTLEDGLGERFTPEIRDAWTALYTAFAEAMTREH